MSAPPAPTAPGGGQPTQPDGGDAEPGAAAAPGDDGASTAPLPPSLVSLVPGGAAAPTNVQTAPVQNNDGLAQAVGAGIGAGIATTTTASADSPGPPTPAPANQQSERAAPIPLPPVPDTLESAASAVGRLFPAVAGAAAERSRGLGQAALDLSASSGAWANWLLAPIVRSNFPILPASILLGAFIVFLSMGVGGTAASAVVLRLRKLAPRRPRG